MRERGEGPEKPERDLWQRGIMIRMRFGDRDIERPLGELVLEGLFAPFFLLTVFRATRCGWGH